MVVAKVETTAIWSNTLTEVGADSYTDGQYNTNRMIDSPAKDYVTGLREGGYDDWYLPSVMELRLLQQNIISINTILEICGVTIISMNDDIHYWSSTENKVNPHISEAIRFHLFDRISQEKNIYAKKLRAIRKFEIDL